MTRAGLGDLLAKHLHTVDWLASHELYGEQFLRRGRATSDRALVHAATHAEDIIGGSLEAVSGFLAGLVESGIAMAMIGNSRTGEWM